MGGSGITQAEPEQCFWDLDDDWSGPGDCCMASQDCPTEDPALEGARSLRSRPIASGASDRRRDARGTGLALRLGQQAAIWGADAAVCLAHPRMPKGCLLDGILNMCSRLADIPTVRCTPELLRNHPEALLLIHS